MLRNENDMLQAIAVLKQAQEKVLFLLNVKNFIARGEIAFEKEASWAEQDAGLWLSYIGSKMLWKYGEYINEGLIEGNPRKKHKPEKEQHYSFFGEILANAPLFLQKVLEGDSFIAMTPKKEVMDHLLTTFNYTPLDCTANGLWLYPQDDKICLAFGNEAVQEANILERHFFCIQNLITSSQNKKDLLEKLWTQKKTGAPLDQEMLTLESRILQKPKRCILFQGEGEEKPSFLHTLLCSLQETIPEMTEEALLAYLEQREKGASKSLSIEGIIEEKIVEKIQCKIIKLDEKIDLLKNIMDSFDEELEKTWHRRVTCFKLKYPFLEDMFD